MNPNVEDGMENTTADGTNQRVSRDSIMSDDAHTVFWTDREGERQRKVFCAADAQELADRLSEILSEDMRFGKYHRPNLVVMGGVHTSGEDPGRTA